MNEKVHNIITPAPGMALRCRNGHMNSWDPRVIATSDGSKVKLTAVRCAAHGCGHTIYLEVPSMLEAFGRRTDRQGNTLVISPGAEPDGESEQDHG